jgi:peptide/nickel transport system substrate-binding protein
MTPSRRRTRTSGRWRTSAARPTPPTGGPGQLGDYSNPRADALINQSISGSNPAAVTKEMSFFTSQLPVLWQPVPDYVWAWKSNISATTPTAIENLTQYDDTPQFWYLTK